MNEGIDGCFLFSCIKIQRVVISGGNFKPDTLKPKEVVSLLLDDDELEKKRESSRPSPFASPPEAEGISCLCVQCVSGRRRRGSRRRAAR